MSETARIEETIAPIGVGATFSSRGYLHAAIRWLAPVALGVLVVVQAGLFREWTCETYDEFTYLRMGISIYRQGDFQSLASPMCPPLPILLEYALPSLRARSLPGSEGWQWEVPTLIRQARLATSIVVGVPLVGVVYAWLARRRGWAAGLLGGGLVALSPTVMAAASVATTDACFALFALVALASLHRYQLRPSWGSLVAAGASMGLALASKQSAVFLFPVALVELVLVLLRNWPGITSRSVEEVEGATRFGTPNPCRSGRDRSHGFGVPNRVAPRPSINREVVPGLKLRLPERKPGATRVDFCLLTLSWLAKRLGALIALAFLVDWAAYGFGLAGKFGSAGTHVTLPEIVPMIASLFPNSEAIVEVARQWGPPLAIDSLVGQMEHASVGQPAFLMGQHSTKGWWYFFPVAIALKSTPAELLMMGLVVLLAARPGTWRDPARRLWLGSIVVLLGAGMCSSLNIGHRYMLLIYPLVALLVADWLGEKAAERPARAVALGVLLLAWHLVSIVGITPHYLAYFNTFCGGPSQGYRYLVDSSLDWGQDLPGLRRELEARHYQRVALCYFGTANAQAYHLRSTDWLERNDSVANECDWLAISATAMQTAYGGPADLHDRLRKLPSTQVGYSIFLYDLKDPRIRAAWDDVRHRH